ncbi:hypothetical protein TNCV_4635111 [Trichonephila clavipes]|nr:hypothetical protein TNCV_4635111 [Trichonephila clavipes]
MNTRDEESWSGVNLASDALDRPAIETRENRHIIRHARVEPTSLMTAVLTQAASSLQAPVSSRTISSCMVEGHLISWWCPLRLLPMISNHRRLYVSSTTGLDCNGKELGSFQ